MDCLYRYQFTVYVTRVCKFLCCALKHYIIFMNAIGFLLFICLYYTLLYPLVYNHSNKNIMHNNGFWFVFFLCGCVQCWIDCALLRLYDVLFIVINLFFFITTSVIVFVCDMRMCNDIVWRNLFARGVVSTHVITFD